MALRRIVPPAALAAGAFFFLHPGTAHADDIEGTQNPDQVDGTESDDSISTFESDDTVDAGAGDDEVFAGEGDDTVNGDAGDDDIVGDTDTCNAQSDSAQAADTFSCGFNNEAGDDTLNGGEGDDTIFGDGNLCDEPTGQPGIGVAAGGEAQCTTGDDTINGGPGDDLLSGDGTDNQSCRLAIPEGTAEAAMTSPFEDCLLGGTDTVNGGDGDDVVEGGPGDDVVNGGAGDDFVIGDDLFLIFGPEGDIAQEFFFTVEDLEAMTEAEFNEFIAELMFLSIFFPGGDDLVTGDPGVDVLLGMHGNDLICGDAADPLLLGNEGSDLPCPVFEETLDARTGPVSGDVGTGIRELDDELFEVDENGAANPYEFILITPPTKGVLTFDSATGLFTYTPNPGATGTDTFEYAIRRCIVDCPDFTVVLDQLFPEEANPAATGDQPCDLLLATAIITEGETRFIVSGSKVVTILLPDPVVPKAAVVPQELARTGLESTALALVGLGLLSLGALVEAEARRRRRVLA